MNILSFNEMALSLLKYILSTILYCVETPRLIVSPLCSTLLDLMQEVRLPLGAPVGDEFFSVNYEYYF